MQWPWMKLAIEPANYWRRQPEWREMDERTWLTGNAIPVQDSIIDSVCGSAVLQPVIDPMLKAASIITFDWLTHC